MNYQSKIHPPNSLIRVSFKLPKRKKYERNKMIYQLHYINIMKWIVVVVYIPYSFFLSSLILSLHAAFQSTPGVPGP